MKQFLILSALLCVCYGHTQSIHELYDQKKYNKIIKASEKKQEFTAEELYLIGIAYFKEENDEKAIEYYDKAISNGYKDAKVYYFKGVSLLYLKKYEKSIAELESSIQLDPGNDSYVYEKAMAYYYWDKYDKSLDILLNMKRQLTSYSMVYYRIARIYHEQNEFDKALAEYYNSLNHIASDNEYYVKSLKGIGQLQYGHTKDYEKSITAYKKVLEMEKDDYEVYYKLIKGYNAMKRYSQGDSLFEIVKAAYKKGKLPKEDMEIKSIAIAQFEWNGQIAVIHRSLEDPKEVLDITYKVFLLSPEGDKVVRRFLVEKTMQLDKESPNFLLCEKGQKAGSHITYPYGWIEEVITINNLEEVVRKVLDGKMKFVCLITNR